jgi:glycosyltransferase involved in cell wall biosynthesis
VNVREPLRVLALSKRQYMGHDLLDERYGRFRELPLGLARQGAQVRGLCVSYRRRPEVEVVDADGGASVAWRSFAPRRVLPGGGYWREVDRLRESFRPHVVWAGSDIPQLVLGRRVARRLGAAFVCDLYDNFESYPQARMPGMVSALRRAVASADAVACISEPLARRVRDEYGFRGSLAVIENAVPAGQFHARPRDACRAQFGLPAQAKLVGTAGAISRTRGVEVLFEAFQRMHQAHPDLHLVLAGVLDPSLELPRHERVHYLGLLPPTRVPELLGALDVSVVCNRDSEFGRYCVPQKLYESLACGIPTVAADLGAAHALLARWPGLLFRVGDADALKSAIEAQLAAPVVPQLPIPTWGDLSVRLHQLLDEAAGKMH